MNCKKTVKIEMICFWYKLTKIIAEYLMFCYNIFDLTIENGFKIVSSREILGYYQFSEKEVWGMNIGIIAHNSKKSLIEDFCVAYKGILAKHQIYATGITGRRIEEATNLHVQKFLAGSVGGDKQFMAMIERNGMDMVILFHNPNMTDPYAKEPNVYQIASCCDQYNIPVATNIATAESLILGLDRGDLDWREQLK